MTVIKLVSRYTKATTVALDIFMEQIMAYTILQYTFGIGLVLQLVVVTAVLGISMVKDENEC